MMIAVLVFIAAIAIGALGVVGWVVDVADSAPNLSAIVPRVPHGLTRIYAADGSLLGYVHADTVFSYAPPNRIPNTLKRRRSRSRTGGSGSTARSTIRASCVPGSRTPSAGAIRCRERRR